MKSLQLAVEQIKKDFPQKPVLLREYNYNSKVFDEKPNPKYLFRGEEIYQTTRSNYHRLTISDIEDQKLREYIFKLSFSLMPIIKKDFNLDTLDINDPNYKRLTNQVGAFLQHYGFPIVWLDFTEDIEIAAFFTSYKNNTGKGRIWIVETQNLIKTGEKIIKLDGTVAKRPTLQKAYALMMPNAKPDFQNPKHFKAEKIEFNISADDVKYFDKKHLLYTDSDEISDFIINYIEQNEDNDLKELLFKIKNGLKQ